MGLENAHDITEDAIKHLPIRWRAAAAKPLTLSTGKGLHVPHAVKKTRLPVLPKEPIGTCLDGEDGSVQQ